MFSQGAVDPLLGHLGLVVPQETMTMTIPTNWRRIINLAQASEKKWKIVENELNLTLDHLVLWIVGQHSCNNKPEKVHVALVEILLWGRGGGVGGGEYSTTIWI